MRIKKTKMYDIGGLLDELPGKDKMAGMNAMSYGKMGFQLGNSILPGVGGLVGGALGALGGGIYGKMLHSKQRKELEQMEMERDRQNRLERERRNLVELGMTPTQGTFASYSKGGLLRRGNTFDVMGGSHEMGGVPIGTNNEVEGGEVVYKNRVFSDRLGFSEIAKSLRNSKRQKMYDQQEEELGKTMHPIKMNTIKRNMEKTGSPLEELFTIQEMSKKMLANGGITDPPKKIAPFDMINRDVASVDTIGEVQSYYGDLQPVLKFDQVPIGPYKGRFRKGLEHLFAPADRGIQGGLGALSGAAGAIPSSGGFRLIDNAVNLALTQNTPQIPTPIKYETPALETKINNSAGINAIDNQAAITARLIKESNRNQGVINSNLIANSAEAMRAKNEALQNQTNMETELRNRQRSAFSETANRNADLENQYRFNRMLRRDDIANRYSENAANLVEDIGLNKLEQNKKRYDDQYLLTVLSKYADTGVLDRTEILPYMEQIQKGRSLNSVLGEIQRKKKEKEQKEEN